MNKMDMEKKARMIIQDLVPDSTMPMIERKLKMLAPRLVKGVKALVGKITRGLKNNRMNKKKI